MTGAEGFILFPPASVHGQTLHQVIWDHFVSLNAKADHGLSDLTELLSPPPFQC